MLIRTHLSQIVTFAWIYRILTMILYVFFFFSWCNLNNMVAEERRGDKDAESARQRRGR